MSPPPWKGGMASSRSRLAVEHADAGRAVELVAGEDVEVATERLHVDRAGAATAWQPSTSTGAPLVVGDAR